MSLGTSLIESIQSKQDLEQFKDLHWSGTFAQYLDRVRENPRITRNAFQRIYDMILSYGSEDYVEFKKRITRYRLFDDPIDDGKDAIFGIDVQLQKLVQVLKAAAMGYGPEKRVILLHGPVGSAKSTIVRLLKKGVEQYSRVPEGALYTFSWKDETVEGGWLDDPVHDDPLKLIPDEVRASIAAELSSDDYTVVIKGELSPLSRFMYKRKLEEYDGDWSRVIEDVRVKRIVLSEKDRVGVGTFQPKDEKNQDSTELTGDVNYRKIAQYGSDSDPRAFNFDGEFHVANRGLIEFVEVLKLDVAFLYDLLTASQEHKIKPKKFPQCDIDEVIIGHTNEPEYRKLQNNEFMEALRDRTIRIDIPYCTRLSNEVRIYTKDFNNERIVGKFIAPHTVEMAAMWGILTRLEDPKKASLSRLQKLKLYNGRSIPGFTEDNVKELRKEARREGLEGISPRYIQDKISNALVKDNHNTINPFMVLNELDGGLKHHSLVSDEETRKVFRELLAEVKKEYENIVKTEVQKAISADEDAISRLCSNYIDNIKAYTQKEKVKNTFTGEYEDPDERLMRSIEDKIEIPEARKDDFRREIMNYIGALSLDGRSFDYRSNERLHRALERKLFEDQKDSIKLSSLVSNAVDEQTQEKIDVVKSRLIRDYGYNEESAADVLQYVASIFARGDSE
ncbi:MAG: serine protein kinase [Deltaproteobacteria bacterium]|nr:serine protein kinase [Deltaproteobacteria bacterium]